MTNALIARQRAPWLLGGAGVALLLAQAALPVLPDDAVGQIAAVVSHQGQVVCSAIAFVVAAALLILSVAAVNSSEVPRARALTRVGLVVTAVGALWPATGRGAFNLFLAAIGSGSDRASAVTAAHAIGSSGAFGVLLVTLAAFVVGPIVLTIGLWRAGVVAPWPALLWLIGVLVVNGASTSSQVVSALGMAAVAAALVWLGLAVRAFEIHGHLGDPNVSLESQVVA